MRKTWWIVALALLMGQVLYHFYAPYLAPGMDNMVVMMANLSIVMVSLVQGFVITIALFYTIQKHHHPETPPLFAFLSRAAVPLILEGLRAFAQVLMFLLLLIIPGIFKYVRFYFVPLVVLFDSEYDHGSVDALEKSNALVKGITFPLFLILVLTFGFQLGMEKVMMSHSLIHNPVEIGVGIFVQMLFYTYSYLFMYHLFWARNEGLRALIPRRNCQCLVLCFNGRTSKTAHVA